jgi:hypothetical protein
VGGAEEEERGRDKLSCGSHFNPPRPTAEMDACCSREAEDASLESSGWNVSFSIRKT